MSKKLFVLGLASLMLLTSCRQAAEPSSLPDPDPAAPELPADEGTGDFVVPVEDHPIAAQLSAYMQSYGSEYLFPEFSDVGSLPYSEGSVSTNLFLACYLSNEELRSMGGGIDDETQARLEATGNSMFVHGEDLDYMGRHYFGGGFAMPATLVGAPDISRLAEMPDYYAFTTHRGGLSQKRYLLVDVIDGEIGYTGIFYPFIVGQDMGSPIEGLYLPTADGELRLAGTFVLPDHFEGGRLEDYYPYLHLAMPQSEFTTLSIYFEMEEGRVVARSAQYNYPEA